MKKGAVGRAALAILVQIALVTGLSALLIWLSILIDRAAGGAVYDWIMWGAVPLVGLGSSLLATRLGAPYGLAWIAPPLCQVAAHWTLIGLLPSSPGMPMVVLVLSAFGAAAGEEQIRRGARAKRNNSKMK